MNLVGALLHAQIRLAPGTPGDPLVDLTLPANPPAQGVFIDSIGVENGVPVTYIGMRIDRDTLKALPSAGEIGDDTLLSWDMIVTPSGQDPGVWFFGDFTVREGVTVNG
jgi:hypothetical protein